MIAVHRDPGPHGYAVITQDVLLADKLTAERAILMVRNGKPLDPKEAGNHRIGPTPSGERHTTHRRGPAWEAHLEAQSWYDG